MNPSAPGESSSAPSRDRVAFIFDDGPQGEMTPKFLALLAGEKVRVSFAYIGKNVVANPSLAKAAHDAGHELINHTFSHPHLPDLEASEIQRELTDTQKAIAEASGFLPRWLWAPYGHWNASTEEAARAVGMEHFPWKRFHVVSTEDWNVRTNGETIRHRATHNIQDRTIINCHEWRVETLEEFPAILAKLRGQGCEFLTFSELAQCSLRQ